MVYFNVRDADSGTYRLAWLAAFLMLMAACNGDGCDMDGFTQTEYPEEHYDKAVPGSGEVRLTSHGFDFLGDEIDVLAEELMDDELSFCVEPTSESGVDICHEDTECDNGDTGCQVDLEILDAELNPEDPNRLDVKVVIGLHEQLPVTILSVGDCWLELFSDSGGSDEAAEVEATVPVYFEIDDHSELDDVTVEIGDLDLDLNDLDFSIEDRDTWFGASCFFADGIASFLDDTLLGLIKDEVDDAVEDLEDELCRNCGEGELACPQNAYCDEGDDEDDDAMCMYDDVDECVPMLLGIEGLLELDDLIDEYLPHGAEGVYTTARVADRAEANTGLSLGLKVGTEPENESTCAPVYAAERPPFEPIDPAPSLQGDYDPDGEPYMFGLGLHRQTVQHLLWSIWAGGGLCLEVGADEVDMLTTNTFATFLDSIRDIAVEDGPMKIVLSPQVPPDVELGANVVDGGDVVDPLIDLIWDDLDVHMYGYVQERYARLFTLRVDLELPVAMVPEDEGVLPVLGDVEEAIQNIRLQNDDLIAEDQQTFEDLIPTILDFALPELMDELDDPIELPELEGYRPVIEEGGLRGIDGNEYIGLFASLEYVGQGGGEQLRIEAPRAIVSDHHLEVTPRQTVPEVLLDVEVAAEQAGTMLAGSDVEFLIRVNGGMWRTAGTGPVLEIDSPSLRLPGEHQVELRARKIDDPSSGWQSEPTSMDVVVHVKPPRVDAYQAGHRIEVEADDAVDDVEHLQMRYRYVVGGNSASWSQWGDVDTIEFGDGSPSQLEAVDIEVRDRGGMIGDATVEVQTSALSGEEEHPPAGEQTDSSYGGCTSSKGPMPPLVVVFGLLAVAVLRRRRPSEVAAVAAVAVAFGAGCSDDTPVEEGLACGGDCDDGLVCCYETDSCQEPPEPCEDYECKPGYEVQVEAGGQYNEMMCELVDTACSCQVRDPVPMDYHGSYPSIDAGGDDVVALSVHNLGYRDLMVGILDGAQAKAGIDEWHFVDGVPEDGAVAGDPYGPRGGIIMTGDEVGTHTATAVDDEGRIHVFYRDENEDALKYARGQREGDDWEFDTTVVEGGDVDTGHYSTVGVDGDALVLFYTAVDDDGYSEIRHRRVDVDHPVDEVGDTDIQVVHPRVDDEDEDNGGDDGDDAEEGDEDEEEFVDYPEMAGLFLQLVETDEGWFVSFFDNVTGEAGWLVGDGEDWEKPEFLDEDGIGPYTSARLDADGDVHVAFMDRNVPALVYRAADDGDREYIAGGVRDHDTGWSETNIGHDVQLHVDGDDIDVLYHDASMHKLRRGVRNEDGLWEPQTLAGAPGQDQVARGLFVRSLQVDGRRLIVDFSVDTVDVDNPEATPVVDALD